MANPINPCIFDDFYDTNTQFGSQWDGFRHFCHLGINKMYNNLDPKEIFTGVFAEPSFTLRSPRSWT